MTTKPDAAPSSPPQGTGGTDEGIRFARVLVALTGGEASRAMIEAACLAARATNAALAALYVREQRLADLAALPFATVLAPGHGVAEALTLDAVERAWLRAEAACRAALHSAHPAGTVAFQSVSGRIETAVVGHAGPGDLLVLGPGGGLQAAPSGALVKAAARAAGAVLVVPAIVTNRTGPVVAIDDGDTAGAGTIRMASRLARASGRPLALLALAAPGMHGALAARAASLAGGPFALHTWPAGEAAGVADALRYLTPSMVVADLSGAPFAEPGVLGAALRRATAPLLLMSGHAAQRIASQAGAGGGPAATG